MANESSKGTMFDFINYEDIQPSISDITLSVINLLSQSNMIVGTLQRCLLSKFKSKL